MIEQRLSSSGYYFAKIDEQYLSVITRPESSRTFTGYRYNLATEELVVNEVWYSTNSNDVYQFADINDNDIATFAWGEGGNVWLATADISGDITPPKVVLNITQTEVETDGNIAFNWSVEDTDTGIASAELYLVRDGAQQQLLASKAQAGQWDHQYSPTSAETSNDLKFLVIAIDNNGNQGQATHVVRHLKPVNITQFKANRYSGGLGDSFIFSWQASGVHPQEAVRLEKQDVHSGLWTTIFDIVGNNSYILSVGDFAGEFAIRLKVRQQTFDLSQNIVITSSVVNITYPPAMHQSNYYVDGDNPQLTLQWITDIQADSGWVAEVYLKKDGDSAFVHVGTSFDNALVWLTEGYLGNIQWYVSLEWADKTFVSSTLSAQLAQLAGVTHLTGVATQTHTMYPAVILAFDAVA
ncbi:MAG: hypothetical protein MJK04_27060, partial [Psychrosphaera sp.]|nr:hypothetical protein [Psychrosphaera sp.]